ncbi:hypothetical protein PR202_gb18654 [Eleusine coracana subsp. coracana]|uniref:STAS domain-containing protein n=1 Tax=Eleusine coracana subsp. coracana TaxID=191504 RepID=A0AAV5F661_ELECO|nr:hypothetical protein PR202_gb18654 [Eleusine coracana subsp. coracana]
MGGGSTEANGNAVRGARVPVPPARPFLDTFRGNLKETFFPDDPFRAVVRERGGVRRAAAALRYFFPFMEWVPAYRLGTFKSDLIAGVTIASLAIPQGISYAKLANLPPILGLSPVKELLGGEKAKSWRWESVLLGSGFLFFLLVTRFISKRRPKLFWISAAAPLTSVVLGSLLVYFTHAENHGIQVVSTTITDRSIVMIGSLKKGLNPLSVTSLQFSPPYMMLALKTGIITGIIALAEGIAVGRSFAMFKNYNIDGNKEMIAIGTMNILGSFTSCYLTTGPFSRSAVNYNAGCKTAMSNVIMSVAVMITLLFLTPLFYYTPLVVLSAIIMSAMLGLIDYPAAVHLWQVDKVDFCVCIGAYLGVVFGSVEIGLVVAVSISILRVMLFIARPRTTVLGNIPNSMIYRRMDQYATAQTVPGVLVLRVDAPIYFANASYLRERISRWIDDEEERTQGKGETPVQYVVLDMGAVGSIDTSGTSMLDELKKSLERRGLQIVLANPGSEVMKKLHSSKVLEAIGHEWIFPTVGEAAAACNYVLHSHKPDSAAPHENMV